MIKYKNIKLKISHKVFQKLQQSLMIKKMSQMDGLTDQVLIKIVKSIDDGEKSVEIKYKTERGLND